MNLWGKHATGENATMQQPVLSNVMMIAAAAMQREGVQSLLRIKWYTFQQLLWQHVQMSIESSL